MTVSIYYYSLFFIQLLQNLQYPHTIFLMWNAQGQLSAPIPSFRSCASRSGANGEWERHLSTRAFICYDVGHINVFSGLVY